MQSLTLLLVVLLLPLVCVSMTGIRYVRPDNSSRPSSCPTQPCLTLNQYANSASAYFIAGSTFVFLPGNHILQFSITLNVSNVTLKGLGSNSSTTIVSRVKHAVICQDVDNLSVEWLTFDQTGNNNSKAAALKISSSREVAISNCIFYGSGKTEARALEMLESNVTIHRNLFRGNTGPLGGAIYSSECYLVLSGNRFIGNLASNSGGAIISLKFPSTITLGLLNEFSHNVAGRRGGAIECRGCTLDIAGNNSFESNHGLRGGAISVTLGHLTTSSTVLFLRNNASEGGAVFLDGSTALLGGEVSFLWNLAENGGGIGIAGTKTVTANDVVFANNVALRHGGGLYVAWTINSMVDVSANFTGNRAECGGAAAVYRSQNMKFTNVTMTENSKSALCIFNSSTVTITGVSQVSHNDGLTGGGINMKDSTLAFEGISTTFDRNTAESGGAISCVQGKISFQSTVTMFTHSRARVEGGAMYVASSSIAIRNGNRVEFVCNSAQRGGAVFFSESSMLFKPLTHISAINNSAVEYGGAIYHSDNPTTSQCTFSQGNYQSLPTPRCFLQTEDRVLSATIFTRFNSAGIDGNVLYGGLLDKCTYSETRFFELIVMEEETTLRAISSEPYQLSLCSNLHNRVENVINIEVFQGQSFSVSLLATAQGGIATSTRVTAVTGSSRLKTFQNTQILSEGCSNLTYTLYSSEAHSHLILYPDGPCRDSGLARVTINVTFLPCPGGFTLSGERCSCEERLRTFDVECTVEEGIQIVKGNNSNFWMGMVPTENGSYGGLILYKSCPAEYCKTQAVSLTLEGLDAQCDLNRSGVLCGQCSSNYSLMLGSSRCDLCSNHFLALLLAFVTAGLALVAFLTFLKLTVATGTLNSLILYANILQVNRRLFLPLNRVNTLTVFIAWLNLDLGIQTCFYDGLTAYAQTWLQFVFPAYVWVLISIIILSARHSVLLSRVIGSDPIAVLATLLLMSYTKILRVIIEVYSFIDLDYPGEERVRVWLKDGNIPYLSSGHLVLTVVTSVVLVLFFLPYTLLLLLGHRLYLFTGHKHFHWFSRIKPLLESYYAPYKPRTRYWTGFLLLVRCALYIVFSFNSLGGTRTSLMAISLTFTALAIVGSGRLYRSTLVNAVEVFVYFNLVVMSTATLAGYKWPALVYSLVGTVLAIMVCAVGYQFHCQYIARTTVWQRLMAKLSPYFQHSSHPAQPEAPLPNPSHDPHKIVSKSVVDLREPLLDV